jgi:hypothetical protein
LVDFGSDYLVGVVVVDCNNHIQIDLVDKKAGFFVDIGEQEQQQQQHCFSAMVVVVVVIVLVHTLLLPHSILPLKKFEELH